jgi:hypothetical protein
MLLLTKHTLSLAITISNGAGAFDAMHVFSGKVIAWPGRYGMRLMARQQNAIKVKI